jgi:hypothetical protein
MKKLIKISLLIAFASFLGGCCLFKTHFSEKELKWLNPYNEGDTLIFISAAGEMDTSWIVQKVIYYPECNPIAHNAKYKFHTARIFYQNSKLNYSSGGKELISVVKYEDRTSINIFYLSAGFKLDSPEMMELFKNILDVSRIESESMYVFSNFHLKSKPEDIEFLYWHDVYGLIKYITHNGMEWKRVNLDFDVK